MSVIFLNLDGLVIHHCWLVADKLVLSFTVLGANIS